MFVSHELTSLKNIDKLLDTIEKKTMNKKSFVLLVHADWCHYCKMLMPNWIETINTLKKNKTDIHIISLTDDVKSYIEQNKPESHLHNVVKHVKSFPTIFGVSHKKDNDNVINLYEGDRSKKSLEKFSKGLI